MRITLTKKQILKLLGSILVIILIIFIIKVNSGEMSKYGASYTWTEKGNEYKEEMYYYESDQHLTCYSNRWDYTKEPELTPCSTLKNYNILKLEIERQIYLE